MLSLKSDYYIPALQGSVEHFVRQFSLTGGCLLRMDAALQNLLPIAYWSASPSETLLTQIPLIAQAIATGSLYDVETIAPSEDSLPYHFYRSHPSESHCLICWHSVPLSSHQQYGVSLYAQSLKLAPSVPADCPPSGLEKILQRTRHQLRTPLALILLYIELLETTVLDARSQEWLENLRSTAEAMNISLDHLTEVAATTESRSRCDLQELLIQSCQEMQPWIDEKHLTLVYDLHPLWLQVDAWKIKQVFQNLLSNAIAFSPHGGQITWEWQIFQTEVLIKISDCGSGLSAEDLRSISTPFYSRRPGGMGLGLSIAKQVILEHQGSLWAANLPTGGAQFCIMLPRQP